MNSATRNILIGVVVVIILVLLGYLVWHERQPISVPASTASTTTTTTTATSTGVSVSGSNTGTATYTVIPITSGSAPTPPNYKAPLTYSSSISASDEAQDESEFEAAQTALASNPKDYPSWIALGMVREATGDYQGAAADWKYVTQLYPTDPTAFANLGDLYANYLSEPSQGIAYYKDAIKLDPTKEATFYENLAEVYVGEGDSADARATLEQGIAAQVVGYQNLQNQLNAMQ